MAIKVSDFPLKDYAAHFEKVADGDVFEGRVYTREGVVVFSGPENEVDKQIAAEMAKHKKEG